MDNKTFGIGWSENTTADLTVHHNWFRETEQRNPSTDNVAHAHLYNNYMQNITSYGNLSRGSTKMVLENSYFDNVANPYNVDDLTKGQLKQSGSIVKNSTGKQVTNGSAFDPKSNAWTDLGVNALGGLPLVYLGNGASIMLPISPRDTHVGKSIP